MRYRGWIMHVKRHVVSRDAGKGRKGLWRLRGPLIVSTVSGENPLPHLIFQSSHHSLPYTEVTRLKLE